MKALHRHREGSELQLTDRGVIVGATNSCDPITKEWRKDGGLNQKLEIGAGNTGGGIPEREGGGGQRRSSKQRNLQSRPR